MNEITIMQMKTRIPLLAALLAAAVCTGASGRTDLREVLRPIPENVPASSAQPGNHARLLHRIPEGNMRLSLGKGSPTRPMRLTSTGAELLGWLSYADDVSTLRGLYVFEPEGFEMEWSDPLWTDPVLDGEVIQMSPQTAWINEGKICGYAYQIFFGVLRAILYVEYDFESGELLEIQEVDTEQSGQSVIQMAAYDITEDTIYGYGQLEGGFAFISADPDAPEYFNMVRPVETSEFCPSLCYNKHEDALYGINQNHEFVRIDSEGYQEPVFTLPFTDYGNYGTGLAYNPVEKVYYWNMIDASGVSNMVRIDAVNKTAEVYESFDLGETFSTLFCLDDKIDAYRPKRPSAVSMDFPDGSTTGTVIFMTPSETMNGLPISGDLTYTAYVDSEKYSEGTASPGKELEVEYSGLSDAMHTFGLTVTLDGVESSAAIIRGYVGNDIPLTPQDVKLTETEVTWRAVTQGVHGAYIDTEAMRYEVYINGESIGVTSETHIAPQLPDDKPLTLYKASVKAICNGMESRMSGESNGVVAGEPMHIPVYLKPTKEEFELMSVYDPNKLGWYYTEIDLGEVVTASVGETQADNWLFLPPVSVDDVSKLYTFSLTAFSWGEWYTEEYLEVLLCSSPSPESVISTVIGEFNANETPTDYSGLIQVPEPGTYYVALHCTSAPWQLGVVAKDFRIDDDNILATSPEAPSDIEAKADEKGALEATVSFDMPTTRINGEILPEDTELTATVASATATSSATGRPGEHVSVKVATEQGDNWITVTASDGTADGRPAKVQVYTGVSIPGDVTSLKAETSADMMSVHLEWNRPETGIDGGYINPEDVTYDIYRYEQNFIGWDWQIYAQDIKETEFVYTAAEDEIQNVVQLAVATKNAAGTSGNMVAASALVGAPYILPVSEDFENPYEMSFDPWIPYYPTAEYQNQVWQITYLDYFDFDMMTGTIGLLGTSYADNCLGMLGFPRFSTAGCGDVAVTLTILNGPNMPEITLSGEYYGSEMFEIGSIKASETKGMSTYTFNLPSELLGKDWVQIYLNVDFSTYGQIVYVEDVDIRDTGTGIRLPEGKAYVAGGYGEIKFGNLDGEKCLITTPDGRIRFNGIIDSASVPAESGMYIVNVGSMTTKVLVR